MPRRPLLALAALAFLSSPAHATFHLMQIEQVIGGVDGDPSVQAIQLRMRSATQNFVSSSRVVAWDAAGANPIVVADPTTNVASGVLGARVLLATASFAAHTSPAAAPDFVMSAPIPVSYLAAGCLTFENDAGTQVLWRLSWGGAGYTGAQTGLTFNDADGNFGPAYAGALPVAGAQALRFQGSASALSLNSDADYMPTTGAAVFVNNAGASFTVSSVTAAPEIVRGAELLGEAVVAPNPFSTSTRVEFRLARAAVARVVIVDTLGRRVGEVSRSLGAGTASLEWNGRDAAGRAMPAGVYFYRLTADRATKAGQLLLIR